MWWKQILPAIVGLGSGFIVAGGVFALISSVGIIPRLAGKTHTGKFVRRYEDCVILGGTLGNLLSIYNFALPVGSIGAAIYGICAGIYVGVLALSLAESINATAVFSRRANLKMGLCAIVLAVALGKGFGAFLMFFNRWG